MNLNNTLTPDDLAQLFSRHKDKDESHILWVSASGEVRLDRLPGGMAEEEFEKCVPTLRVRLKTYRRGNGYVGKKAAADRDFIGRVHRTLTEQWHVARGNPGVHYVDRYC